MDILGYERRAKSLLLSSRSRVTRSRIRVLVALLSCTEPQSHQSIERHLQQEGPIDRVTLYRILEWLVEARLVRRFSGEDRVWRFSIESQFTHASHAHFHCTGCGDIACLSEVSVPDVLLPNHLKKHEIDLTVRGYCRRCAELNAHQG